MPTAATKQETEDDFDVDLPPQLSIPGGVSIRTKYDVDLLGDMKRQEQAEAEAAKGPYDDLVAAEAKKRERKGLPSVEGKKRSGEGREERSREERWERAEGRGEEREVMWRRRCRRRDEGRGESKEREDTPQRRRDEGRGGTLTHSLTHSFSPLAFAESVGRDSADLDPWEKHLTHLLIESQSKNARASHVVSKLNRALKAKSQSRTVEQQEKFDRSLTPHLKHIANRLSSDPVTFGDDQSHEINREMFVRKEEPKHVMEDPESVAALKQIGKKS